jgi:hypothetical protein
LLAIDGWNLVGPWVIRVGESECGAKFGFKGQKNISHKNIEISIFMPKEGPMVDDRVLPGSKEHQLPGSKVKGQKNINTKS